MRPEPLASTTNRLSAPALCAHPITQKNAAAVRTTVSTAGDIVGLA